ncbi:hypothetical protein CYMTET_33405 [Cymbomonas tetramitiformis]|uniref:Uncharacterized protein n=1 Tax=Cymbomonas tetramitiformis TaxID=36881 RepID=A0AAE0FDT1_9CHLO|nr:hypothetical protein CYMTET_33405 [Cymbomonas tetramitiformis]
MDGNTESGTRGTNGATVTLSKDVTLIAEESKMEFQDTDSSSQVDIHVEMVQSYTEKPREEGIDVSGENGGGDPEDEKAVDAPEPPKTKSLLELYRFADFQDKIMLFLGLFFSAVAGGAQPTVALFIGRMIDTLQSEEDMEEAKEEVGLLAIGLTFLGVVLFAGFYLKNISFNIPAVRQYAKIKARYLEAVLRQDITWFDDTSPGKLQSRITGDTLLIQSAVGSKVGDAVAAVCQIISGFTIAFSISWKLALVVLSIMPFMAVAMGAFVMMMGRYTDKASQANSNTSSISQQALSSIRTVSALTLQKHISTLFEAEAIKRQEAEIAGNKSLMLSIGVFIGLINASYALATWYGAQLVYDDELNGGEVLTVFWAILFGGMAFSQIGPAMEAVMKGKIAAYEVFELIDRVPPIDSSSEEGLKPVRCMGEVELRAVHFHYPSRPEVPVFNNYNLHVAAGQTVALVGESGGGKSTVIGLIERFYDPVQGKVLLDGVDLQVLNLQWLRAQIGLVAQEPVLFAASILENVQYGKVGATQAEVEEAAKMANAHEFVSKFPDGYETQVGERGVQLSGGQKQRIAIARAVIRDPRILLLDEATSALDSESEQVVQAALDHLLQMKRRTTIVVAHRLSTIKDADSIAVIYDGRIVEQGTHNELAGMVDGYYTNLLALQDLSATTVVADGSGVIAAQPATAFGSPPGSPMVGGPKKSAEFSRLPVHFASPPDKQGANLEPDPDDVLAVNLATADAKQLKKLDPKSLPEVDPGRLRALVAPDWWLMLIGLFGAVVGGASSPFLAVLLGLMVDIFYETDRASMKNDANTYALLFVVLAVVVALAQISQHAMGIVGARFTSRLGRLFFERAMHQDVAFHDTLSPGILNAQLAHDTTIVSQAQGAASTRVRVVATFVSVGVTMLYFSWKMALVSIATMPVLIGGGLLQSAMWKKQATDAAEEVEAQVVAEAVGAMRTVSALQLQADASHAPAQTMVFTTCQEACLPL